ncbi:MAG: hypothetical protein V3S45_04000, partial [Kiloniellales bacterium]
PPSADTQADLSAEQGGPLPEQRVIYRLVSPQPAATQTAQTDVPPSAGTRADLDAEQGGPLPEQRVIYRLVSPQPTATQTAQADRVEPGTEYLGGLW